MLLENLIAATGMVAGTVIFHFVGLAALIGVLNSPLHQRLRARRMVRHPLTILLTVFGLIGMHTVEIWAYASLYLVLGEFGDLQTALYYSATTFSTLGYGDVVLSEAHRMIGAIEGVNGFILIGWSTAFLVSVTNRMGLLDARLKHSDEPPPYEPSDSP